MRLETDTNIAKQPIEREDNQIQIVSQTMRTLDEQEQKIVRALIKNARLSDNHVSKLTGVPVMTVNRKRKALEREGLLMYFAHLRRGLDGMKKYNAKQMYIIKFRMGMTKEAFLEGYNTDPVVKQLNAGHLLSSHLGEKDGHLALVLIVRSRYEEEAVDIFNGIVVPQLKKQFGEDVIVEISTIRISKILRMLHNYLPDLNMENGHIKDSWKDAWIFVD